MMNRKSIIINSLMIKLNNDKNLFGEVTDLENIYQDYLRHYLGD